jgi:hypothetical protein
MAIQFQRLATPGEGVSTLMDFAPLAGAVNDGITGYYDNKRRTAIGAAAQQGNAAAAQEALKQGELETGAQYQRLAQQDTDRATQSKDRQIKMLGGIAQAAKFEKDPARRALLWNTGLKRAGVNPADLDPDELDPMTGPDVFLAASGMAQDPREDKLMDLKLAGAEMDLAKAGRPAGPEYKEINGRLVQIGPDGSVREVYAAPDAGRPKQSPTELKAMFAAEDEIPNLDNTITSLEAAKSLNPKAYSGFLSETRANIGTALPERMQPQSARDSSEFNKLMSMEAIQVMAASLKGATTDTELDLFVELLGDPSTPPEIRGRTIDRMLSLANAQKTKNQRRLEMLSDGGRYTAAPVESPAAGAVVPPAGSLPSRKVPRPMSAAERDAIPSGTLYIAPDGEPRIKK